jgi:hypothetical protein
MANIPGFLHSEKSSMRSINFSVPEPDFKTLKIYAACKAVPLKELVAGIVKNWISSNGEDIQQTVKTLQE